jgi:hypothetical protein
MVAAQQKRNKGKLVIVQLENHLRLRDNSNRKEIYDERTRL